MFQPRYARFLRSYAKKYCTEMNVSPFLRYLPFSLFLVPLIIVFVEKFFIRYRKNNGRLNIPLIKMFFCYIAVASTTAR